MLRDASSTRLARPDALCSDDCVALYRLQTDVRAIVFLLTNVAYITE